MTKAALFKPLIYFKDGFWRVQREAIPWRYIRQADRDRITKAHEHAFRLNNTDEAEGMREAYYQRLRVRKAQEKRPV